MVIGFFLRALRICSEDSLQEEIEFIIESFRKLKYPLAELILLKEKANKIMARARASTDVNQPEPTLEKPTTTVIVPNSAISEPLRTLLNPTVSVVTTGGQKLGGLLKTKRKTKDNHNNQSMVYRIPCGVCHRVYYGETGRGLTTRMREHKADLRFHRSSNAFVAHVDEVGHLPDWAGAASIRNLTRSQRKIIEAAFIANGSTINTSAGFFRLSSVAASVLRNEYVFEPEEPV